MMTMIRLASSPHAASADLSLLTELVIAQMLSFTASLLGGHLGNLR